MFNNLSVNEIAAVSVAIGVAGGTAVTAAGTCMLKAFDKFSTETKFKMEELNQKRKDTMAEYKRRQVSLKKMANAHLSGPSGIVERSPLLLFRNKKNYGMEAQAIKLKYRKS